MPRCDWCGEDPLYVAYHDDEWGLPQRCGRQLFETLSLEAFQAGLSWLTILRKRENFRRAFAGFAPEILADWGPAEVDRLLQDPGIVRHRGKIEATLGNARAWVRLEEGRAGAFSELVWSAVGGAPQQNPVETLDDVPASTRASAALSKRLRQAGFAFCGPTTTYAFMQAAGLVNDHLLDCPARGRVAQAGLRHG